MNAKNEQSDIMPERLIALGKVAEILGVNKRTVYRLIAKRELPQPLKVGHSVRLSVSDVTEYFERLKLQRRGVLV